MYCRRRTVATHVSASPLCKSNNTWKLLCFFWWFILQPFSDLVCFFEIGWNLWNVARLVPRSSSFSGGFPPFPTSPPSHWNNRQLPRQKIYMERIRVCSWRCRNPEYDAEVFIDGLGKQAICWCLALVWFIRESYLNPSKWKDWSLLWNQKELDNRDES